MPSLEDDIARVAALRGRPAQAANYVQEAKALERASRTVYATEIHSLFVLPQNRRGADLRVFNRLPNRSRALLREMPFNASAEKYADLLARIGDEGALIHAVNDQLPEAVYRWVLKHYGRDHPSTEKRLAKAA